MQSFNLYVVLLFKKEFLGIIKKKEIEKFEWKIIIIYSNKSRSYYFLCYSFRIKKFANFKFNHLLKLSYKFNKV